MFEHNNIIVRKQEKKAGPSGMSRHEAYHSPWLWHKQSWLTELKLSLIHELKDLLSNGEDLLSFTPAEFSARAQALYDSAGIRDLRLDNAWDVYEWMKARM
jgi:hypothetical protein